MWKRMWRLKYIKGKKLEDKKWDTVGLSFSLHFNRNFFTCFGYSESLFNIQCILLANREGLKKIFQGEATLINMLNK